MAQTALPATPAPPPALLVSPPRTSDSRLEQLDDDVLMSLLAGGDLRAFDVLHRRHRAAALGLARRICGPDYADDVVQTTFVSFWRNRGQYRREAGSPRSWLLGIVRNRAIDQLRAHAARHRNTVSADSWAELPVADTREEADLPHERFERAESRLAVRRALGALPTEQRTVLTLAYVRGYSQTEIANTLGVPLGTVKSRVRLGLAKLRVEWDGAEKPARARLASAA